MHLHCNGIRYNVSKGPAAHGEEVLGAIWHRMGTWQGQTTRCSHDVAAVEKQGDWEGRWDGSARENVKGMLRLLFHSYYCHFFNDLIYYTIWRAIANSSWRTGHANSILPPLLLCCWVSLGTFFFFFSVCWLITICTCGGNTGKKNLSKTIFSKTTSFFFKFRDMLYHLIY